jgi:hypothetical protein
MPACTNRSLRHLAWLATPLLAIAGCAQSAAKAAVPDGATPVRGTQNALVTPLGALTNQSPRQSTRLELAQDTLIAECMRARSFTFDVPRLPVPPAGAFVPNAYGLLSAATAARQGYGISDSVLIDEKDGQIGSELQPGAHKPGFTRALVGTPATARSITLPGGSHVTFNANGCATIAIGKLYGRNWNTAYFTVSALMFRIVQGVEASAAWKNAVRAWSECVRKGYGVSFANPDAAEASVRKTASAQLAGLSGTEFAERLKSVRAGEIRLAVIDARCQAGAGLPVAAAKVQHATELPDEKRYAADLSVYAEDMRHAARVTATVLKQKQ